MTMQMKPVLNNNDYLSSHESCQLLRASEERRGRIARFSKRIMHPLRQSVHAYNRTSTENPVARAYTEYVAVAVNLHTHCTPYSERTTQRGTI